MSSVALDRYFESNERHPVCVVMPPLELYGNRDRIRSWVVKLADATTSPMCVLYTTIKLYDYVATALECFGTCDFEKKAGLCFMLSVKYVCDGESADELIVIRDTMKLLRSHTGATAAEMLELESRVLSSVGYNLCIPLAPHFFYEFVGGLGDVPGELLLYGEYALEMSALHSCLHEAPAHVLAASCLYTARAVLGYAPVWSGQLIKTTRCGIKKLFLPVAGLCKAIDDYTEAESGWYVKDKYNASDKRNVASLKLPDYIRNVIQNFPPTRDLMQKFVFKSY